jgi:hypothetical protein
MSTFGPLVPADETFAHQITQTFATVAQSDRSWTEKVCAMAAPRDGAFQLAFGMGKYTNRGVLDAYAGVSRGVEQWTVRSSRKLWPDVERLEVGPIRYEVLEPLRTIRFALDANDCQPIAFDWVFEAAVPPHVEERTHTRDNYRVSAELVRYHQTGVASGWVEVDGARTEITPDTWVSTRDHSWGVRYGVGVPLTDMPPPAASAISDGASFEFLWSPVLMERADGSRYALWLEWSRVKAPGFAREEAHGTVEHPDGRVETIVGIAPEMTYDPSNRRLRGGRITVTMADGTTRPLGVEVVSDTGFHLGAGLYFGFDEHFHGEWRGDLVVDGERIDDCSTPDNARRLHQIRDTVIHVTDPVGGGEGWGNMQPIITGDHPALGLDGSRSFM